MADSEYLYIPNLALSDAQKKAVDLKMTAAYTQLDRLRSEYQPETYMVLSADGRISKARQLLPDNLPATETLLQQTLTLPSLTIQQKMECYHLLYLVYMSLGPLSEGLKVAETAYTLAQSAAENQNATSNMPSTADIDKHGEAGTHAAPFPSLHFQAVLDLTNAHRFLGHLEEAGTYLEQAEGLAQAAIGDKRAEQETMAALSQGDLILARGHLKDAMKNVLKPMLNQDMSDSNKGHLLQSLGNACRAAADWGPAKAHMREAVAIAECLSDTVALADRHGDLGTIFRSEGRTTDALEYQEKQLMYAMQRGDRVGLTTACFNVGFTHYSTKPPDYNKALIYHSIHLELAQSIGYLGMKTRALSALGKIYTALRDYDSALTLLEEGLEVQEEIGNLRGLGIAYGNIGTVYRAIGKFDEAVKYHTLYQENAADRHDVGGVAIMQRELAMDFLFKEDLEMAERHIKDAFVTLQSIRAKIGPEDTSLIANTEKNQAEAFQLLQTILVRRGKYREALALSEQGRARALSDLIQQTQQGSNPSERSDDASHFASTIPDLAEGLAQRELSEIFQTAELLNTTLVVYSMVTEQEPSGGQEKWLYAWVVTRADDKSNQLGRAPSSDARYNVHFARRPMKTAGSSEETERKGGPVEDKEVNALCRSIGELSMSKPAEEQESEVCLASNPFKNDEPLMSHSQDPSMTRDIPQHFEQEVGRVHHTPTKPKAPPPARDPKVRQVMEQLRADYDIFIAPIESYLPDWQEDMCEAPGLTFIPQDYMFNLPFCALLGPDNRHLIEKYILSFVPSVRTLRLTSQRLDQLRGSSATAPPSVLAVGNPTMPHPRIPPLPSAAREAGMVREFFRSSPADGQSVTLTGDQATVDRVRREMSTHNVLHFATHADQDDRILRMIRGVTQGRQAMKLPTGDFTMRGYLVLARSHKNCSGLLMAEEVKGQRLKAEVAVLSCCQTARGQVTGDGVLGLYRAFLVAGAASVVVAHWRIADKATAKFMQHFYQQFVVQRDSARALRQAMLAMLADEDFSNVHQWAGFALIGASHSIGTS